MCVDTVTDCVMDFLSELDKKIPTTSNSVVSAKIKMNK